MTWTRVEERLPVNGARVLGLMDKRLAEAHDMERIQIVRYNESLGAFPDWGFVAWQPLPPPPEDE